jgi:hypothetical protein
MVGSFAMRAGPQRPCRRASDERDELAAFQLIELHPATATMVTVAG